MAAVEGIQDRLVNDELVLDMRVPPDAGSFVADEKRVRQVLFNLLANAVDLLPARRHHHPDGGTASRCRYICGDRPRPWHPA